MTTNRPVTPPADRCGASELEWALETAVRLGAKIHFSEAELSTSTGFFVELKSSRPRDGKAAFVDPVRLMDEEKMR